MAKSPTNDNQVESERFEKQLAHRIDWEAALVDCPSTIFQGFDIPCFELHVSISRKDATGRGELIVYIEDTFTITYRAAEDVVEYAIAEEYIDTVLNHLIVYIPRGVEEDQE